MTSIPTTDTTRIAIGESARLVGGHAWTEERLFEILGSLAPSVDDAATQVLVAIHARRHAEHAQWWRARLPVLAVVDADALVSAPSTATARDIAAIGVGVTVGEKLNAIYRSVLPGFVGVLRDHCDRAGRAADLAVLRTLGLVIADLDSAIAEAKAALG